MRIVINCNKGSVLTHDFHYSVSQEGSAALQVPKAFDVQWPDVGCGVAVGHPLSQVPRHQNTENAVCAPVLCNQNIFCSQ